MLTIEQIGVYLKLAPDSAGEVYPFFNENIEIARDLRVHVDGMYPKHLIDITRPHETEAQKKYRRENFTPITEPAVNSIATSIKKVNQADDFVFTYPEMPARIAEEDNLKVYLEEDFPIDNSLRNWLFGYIISPLLSDPNGVVAVLPSNTPANELDYIRPYPYYFPSERVIDFIEGEFCCLLSDEKSVLTGETLRNASGKVYWFLDKESYIKAIQVGDRERPQYQAQVVDLTENRKLVANLHYANEWMPAFKLGGGKIVKTRYNGQRLYKSILSPCLTYLNQALQRQSDFLVQMVYHVHSEAWQYVTSKCVTCNGTGSRFVEGVSHTCNSCNGQKYHITPTSGLGITTFTPDSTGIPGENGKTIAPPHKGYIEKPLAPTELLKQQVQDDLMSAMKALNMEYAKTTPLAQSGVAKSYDRQEVNNFYFEIARHLVENILRPTVYYIACMRYGKVLPEKQLVDSLPYIPVPRKFDTFSIETLAAQIKEAVGNKMDAAVIFALQAEYASKEFGSDSMEYKLVTLAAQHDPLPFKTEDDRFTILANGGCTKREYTLSAQFNYFARAAFEADPTFFDKKFSEQKDALYALVDAAMATEPPLAVEPPQPIPENPPFAA